MARLGFKGPHTDETKKKISATLKGIHPVGFKKKIICPNCNEPMTCPNLPRHHKLCLLFSKYKHLFPSAKTLRQFKHAKVCLNLSYKINLETYLEMVESQKGCCKICKKKPDKRLSVDHCHKSGRNRGLLCSNCNFILGLCCDDISILESAIKYLKDW